MPTALYSAEPRRSPWSIRTFPCCEDQWYWEVHWRGARINGGVAPDRHFAQSAARAEIRKGGQSIRFLLEQG